MVVVRATQAVAAESEGFVKAHKEERQAVLMEREEKAKAKAM